MSQSGKYYLIFFNGHRNNEHLHKMLLKKIAQSQFCIGYCRHSSAGQICEKTMGVRMKKHVKEKGKKGETETTLLTLKEDIFCHIGLN